MQNKFCEVIPWTVFFTLATFLLFFSTMFLNVSLFVEAEIISKWYALIFGTLVCVAILLFAKNQVIVLDRLSFTLFIFLAYILAEG